MNSFRTSLKRAAAILLLVAVVAPVFPIAVPRAHAVIGVPTIKVADTDMIKPALNGIAWSVAKAVVQSMTRSIVNWINSGFDGSPAFVTNLTRDLRQVGDAVAARYVSDLLGNVSINSPNLNQIVGVVTQGYLLYTSRDAIAARLRYTLNEYARDEEAFRRGSFRQGGFNAWMSIVWRCGNDQFCAEESAREELVNRVDAEMRSFLERAAWGRGFLSWQGDCNAAVSTDGSPVAKAAEGADLNDADKCVGHDVNTPGSVIEEALVTQLGSPVRQLELADSINEIVGALVSQLVTQVVGSTGLLGATRPASGGGRPTLETATTGNETAAQFDVGFEEAVNQLRTQIVSYQTGWQAVRLAASRASQTCSQGLNNPGITREATDALQLADAALIKVSSSLSALASIQNRVTQIRSRTGVNQTAEITQIAREYQCLLSGGVPNANQCRTDAISLSADTQALLLRLTEIADTGCE